MCAYDQVFVDVKSVKHFGFTVGRKAQPPRPSISPHPWLSLSLINKRKVSCFFFLRKQD